MEINYLRIFATVINFALFFAIILAIYKLIRYFKNLSTKNQEIDKKLDTILNKLEKNKEKKDD